MDSIIVRWNSAAFKARLWTASCVCWFRAMMLKALL